MILFLIFLISSNRTTISSSGRFLLILKLEMLSFSLPADKSPGPDGFSTFFFQMYWPVIMKDVVKAVQEFFGARSILNEIKSTFLDLIPKVPGADTLDKFRPISLCNSFYKIISKVLTMRFLKLLPMIISQQ